MLGERAEKTQPHLNAGNAHSYVLVGHLPGQVLDRHAESPSPDREEDIWRGGKVDGTRNVPDP